MTDDLKTVEGFGFSTPAHAGATTSDQAVEIAASFGQPVALKIISPDIIHKTDVGGVELGLSSEDEVRAGYARLLANVARTGALGPHHRCERRGDVPRGNRGHCRA